MKSYKPNWRARQNHFLNYTDVKYKGNEGETHRFTAMSRFKFAFLIFIEETKIKDDLLAEKEQLEILNDWKFHNICSKVKEMVSPVKISEQIQP